MAPVNTGICIFLSIFIGRTPLSFHLERERLVYTITSAKSSHWSSHLEKEFHHGTVVDYSKYCMILQVLLDKRREMLESRQKAANGN
jgi:hypothetical protein